MGWDEAYRELLEELKDLDLIPILLDAQKKHGASFGRPSSPTNPTWDMPWAALSDDQRAATVLLGWTEQSWGARAWPLQHDKRWADFEVEHQKALEALGETREKWDSYGSEPPPAAASEVASSSA